jgi:hypothetical protein
MPGRLAAGDHVELLEAASRDSVAAAKSTSCVRMRG